MRRGATSLHCRTLRRSQGWRRGGESLWRVLNRESLWDKYYPCGVLLPRGGKYSVRKGETPPQPSSRARGNTLRGSSGARENLHWGWPGRLIRCDPSRLWDPCHQTAQPWELPRHHTSLLPSPSISRHQNNSRRGSIRGKPLPGFCPVPGFRSGSPTNSPGTFCNTNPE